MINKEIKLNASLRKSSSKRFVEGKILYKDFISSCL
jgi:hypothetical protein